MAIVRFDTKALFKALDHQRIQRGLTWRQVASEIGISEATITRTSKGGRLEVDGMLSMVSWLGVSVETFIK
jgi:transcriptional regulator with XRE-family HTH domain